jgi:hypothetical protein
MKYEDLVTNLYQENKWKPFKHTGLMWPWPLTKWPQNQYRSSTSDNQSKCETQKLDNK